MLRPVKRPVKKDTMGRQLEGPRLIRAAYVAVYQWRDEAGKLHSRQASLKTKDKATALSR